MKNKFFKNGNKGMTLIELVVVLAIFVVISSIIVFNYSNFRSTTSTQNLANDVALSIREAQSNAIGVRGINSDFQYGHGIHFTTSTDTSNIVAGSNKSFILFVDLNSNGLYDYPGSSNNSTCGSYGIECEGIINISTIDNINDIYLDGVSKSQVGMLDISFKRPNPDAIFCYRVNYSDGCQSNFSNVSIKVSNGKFPPDEVTRMVTVWSTGQISVK